MKYMKLKRSLILLFILLGSMFILINRNPINATDVIDTEVKLQDAIDNAKNGDELKITSMHLTKSIEIQKSINITGVDKEQTILTVAPGYRHFMITGKHFVMFSEMTLNGPTENISDKVNGGITFIDDGSSSSADDALLVVSNIIFKDNINKISYEREPDDNTFGGAIGVKGNEDQITLSVANSVFENNIGYRTGGAINATNGDIVVDSSKLVGNYSYKTGGAVNLSDGDLTVNKSSFSKNESVKTGGAINVAIGDLRIDKSTFDNNKAVESGGAINVSNGVALVDNSTLYNNESNEGGGAIYSENVDIENSTLTENKVLSENGDGGAINTKQLYLAHGTLSGNSVVNGDGGAINVIKSYSPTPINVFGSIVIGNYKSKDENNITFQGSEWHSKDIDYNITELEKGETLSDFLQVKETQSEIEVPKLANNGGTTHTVLLSKSSVARDHFDVDKGVWIDDELVTGQRGYSRPNTDHDSKLVDIGAIEIQAVTSFESAQEKVVVEVNKEKEITTVLKPHFADFNDVQWSVEDSKFASVEKDSNRIIDDNQNSIKDTWTVKGLQVGETKMTITSDKKEVVVLIEVIKSNNDNDNDNDNDKDKDKGNDKKDDSNKGDDNIDVPDGGFDYKIGIVTLVMAMLLGLLYRRLKV